MGTHLSLQHSANSIVDGIFASIATHLSIGLIQANITIQNVMTQISVC